MSTDISQKLQEQVLAAYEQSVPLQIIGSDSKHFYGRKIEASPLSVEKHQGILNYEPTELVITVRAGTPLNEIEKVLIENSQMLGFEAPAFALGATIGGTIACNMSGPRRAYVGAARDFLLGCKIINGKGEILSFGGEVMKNVAGYDVSRLMAGALGTLGVLLEVSLKILPRPELETTQIFECTTDEAIKKMHDWGLKPLPISATCFHDSKLYVRLSGTEKAVNAAEKQMGGENYSEAKAFWNDVKEQHLAIFSNNKSLWRLSLASDTAPLNLEGESLYEWGGALRWLSTNESSESVRSLVESAGGQATLFRGEDQTGEVFSPLSTGLKTIHKNLKHAFDPKNILNPGKMYSDI